MKIFVTGGNGFLGTALCTTLRSLGHIVTAPTSKQCDLTHPQSLSLFTSEKYDQLFHLAAWTQAGDFCLYHPGEQWIINQKLNTHVLEWWQKEQPQAKLVFMGTSCAYAPDSALVEPLYMHGEPIESLYTYAMTKRMLFQGARALQKQYGLQWVCLVPSTLYGPGYHTDGRQMHFIFDLMRKIIRAKEFGETVVLWGNGFQKREIVHVQDFINTMLSVTNITTNDIFNIGSGEEFTIRYFAETICKIIGYDPALIQYDTSKYVGATSKCLVIEKIVELIPDYKQKQISLESGLRSTIDWFYSAKAY